ncbi:MAG: lmo0937 family membrane protein [Planctomycetes bacterium]|nr:lmo0937 family membrane protein [Planctomycetota bacterium]
MLWTIFLILMLMWLLGVISGYTVYGFVHILLLFALVSVILEVIRTSGRRA